MSSSPKVSPSRRYLKARLLSILNPFFLGSVAILSLIAFCIWQYWLNPESLITSVEQEEKQPTKNLLFPETNLENNSNSKLQSNPNWSNSNQDSTSKTSTNKITSNFNSNQDPDKPFASTLGQSDPTDEIFQTVTAENNPVNQPSVGQQTKLYEQLKTAPNIFPNLLPNQSSPAATSPINNNSGGLPSAQVNQYQFGNNGIQGGSPAAVTSPLSQAVNQVMSVQAQRQAARIQTQTQTQTIPRGNAQGYNNYGGYDGGYGGYGATNQTSPYGGVANGTGVNPYNSGQVPAQGYNNSGVAQPQPGFPDYGY